MESNQSNVTPSDGEYKDYVEGSYRGRGKYRGANKNYGYRNKNYQHPNSNTSGYSSNNYNNNYNSGYNSYSTGGFNKYQKKTPYNREVADPYVSQMMMYRAEMYILTKYPTLVDINVRNEGISKVIDENSQLFVIKSFSEEDVHKSIKYSVWSSTKTGNQTLNSAFKMTGEKGGHVYLFFSCNGSGRYVGLARMKSEVDEEKQFMYWTQDSKWPGLFDVEWVFIKDVPFKNFRNICITMKDGQLKPISNARDTQEIPFNEGKLMVETIESFANTNTILEHFEYYDLRQENYDKNYNPI